MFESGYFLEYTGPVNYRTIDKLLVNLKKNGKFRRLDKATGKRFYAVLVEILENIAKHSISVPGKLKGAIPYINAIEHSGKILVSAGNPVNIDAVADLTGRLNEINGTDKAALSALYESKISEGLEKEINGAGLGFLLMKLKSGNNITFDFIPVSNEISMFEIKTNINKYSMRKLIIEQTTNSPKVILDPDNNVFEISGESRPPNVFEFYQEIINWMGDYTSHMIKSYDPVEPVVFNMDFEYFNSSSAKYLLDFSKQIANLNQARKNVAVKWHYEEDDMDMLEAGREMSRIAKIPFEYSQKAKK
jgi:hypothetical protein